MRFLGDNSAAEGYLELLDSASMGYCTLSRKGEILEVSSYLLKILNRESQDLIGKQFAGLVSVETKHTFQDFLERIFAGQSKELCEVSLIVSGAEPNFVRLNGLISKTGENCQILLLDCYSCVHSKKFIQESEEKYRQVFKAGKDAIFLIERESGAMMDVNEAATLLYGYSIEELLKLKHIDLSFEPQATLKAAKELPERIPLRYHKKKNGMVFPVDISASVFILKGREVILCAMRDITDRKASDQKLAELAVKLNEVLSTRDKFFSILAHDLRGPLGAFHNLSTILAEEISVMSIEKIREFAVSMSKSSTTLFEMLENLLEWSRIQRKLTKFEPDQIALGSNVAQFIQVLSESARAKNINVINEVPADLEVFADIRMLESIIRNLVSNAVKFTRLGGHVNISAHSTIDDSVVTSVTDTGIGINQKLLGQLFQLDSNIGRLGTEGEASSGLGLILCKEFVEMHGGKIWVDSEVGKGSTVHFELPPKRK